MSSISECPQGFQLAFDAYEKELERYRDAVFEWLDELKEIEENRKINAFGEHRGQTSTLRNRKQREEDAEKAYKKAVNKLKNAHENLVYVFNKH